VVAVYEDGRRREYIVQDRGGAIGYGHIDVYTGHDNVEEALGFGRQRAHIEIYAPE
jgi:3D (Asp-Asp-Asp) domain-containing protein